MFSAIVFDVNETLLDLKAMDAAFENHFGLRNSRKEWFSEVLKLAFVSTILGNYSDFGAIGHVALEVLEKRHGTPCTDDQRRNILSIMRNLPPHPDVSEGLEALKKAGYRLVALTNSTAATAEVQLTHGGIRNFFERVFSADTIRRLKPAREPYSMVAHELEVQSQSLLMVAAHAWDIAGAAEAGWSTAFVARPGQILDALTPKPAFIASDVVDLARQIVSHHAAAQLKHHEKG